jgi:hypothetical protein
MKEAQGRRFDFFGNEILIGDTVAYVPAYGNSKSLLEGVVTEFSKSGNCVYVRNTRKVASGVIKKIGGAF